MTTHRSDDSDDIWRDFVIDCQLMPASTETFIVRFTRRSPPDLPSFEQRKPLPGGAIVVVESGGAILVAVEFTPPPVPTPDIEEHDYSEKAFEIVRQKLGET